MVSGFGLSRRTLIGASAVAVGAVAAGRVGVAPAAATPPAVDELPLHWLDGVPRTTTGSAFGMPWPRGQLEPGTDFSLQTSDGDDVAVQTWPLAYWPDGSLKWTGHGVGADAGLAKQLELIPGSKSAAPKSGVRVRRDGKTIVLDNGTVTAVLNTGGATVLESISRDGRTTARRGKLILRLQDQPDELDSAARHTRWSGHITAAKVEQSGPVRAVVKLTGEYRIDDDRPKYGNGGRSIMPWTIRIYLYAGAESIRLVHSFIVDGDPQHDFIRGLGLQMQVPMSDATYNRHIRFSGSGQGVWGEPVTVLTGLRREPGQAVDDAQVAGTATPPQSDWASQVRDGYAELPTWNDFSLVQNSADHFEIRKRTGTKACWLKNAGVGDRASGFGYVGGISGGLGFGVSDFWQQYPRALDIRDAGGDTATVTLWSWSPYGEVMDLRPYDKAGHGLDLAYEDNREGWGEPNGVARSTDLQLWALPTTPARDRIAELAQILAQPPQVVAKPAAYHAVDTFGRWSLPDSSSATRKKYEDSIGEVIDFYTGQVDERNWYGFWEYGDVMHTYDADRHSWRYDVGGFAWDNAELGTDAMLWYAFLRSGDPGTFRLARAMTRHVAESDTYHAGPFAGLGSRHNVLPWGCGAKEPRVSEAYTKRFLYYLTADELIGDYLRVGLKLDKTLLKNPPLRDFVEPPAGVPTIIRIGPDWYALVSNWLTEWERTGKDHWRKLIETGMKDIAALDAGLFSGDLGGAVGFDPATGHVTDLKSGKDYKGGYNLSMSFCGDQIMFEATDLIDVSAFRERLLEFARYVQAPAAEQQEHFGFSFNPQVFKTIYSRVTAWAGEQTKEKAVRSRGWQELLDDAGGRPWPTAAEVDGTAVLSPVHEIPNGDTSTNDAAQRALAYIALLAIAPDEAP